MNQQSVTDKVVIVTGAGQGLGEAIANTLGAAGAVVCACDIKEDKVKNVADTVHFVLTQPDETVIPEVMVLPMRVCACDIKEDKVKNVAQAINDGGGTAYPFVLDVRNAEDIRQTIGDIIAGPNREWQGGFSALTFQ